MRAIYPSKIKKKYLIRSILFCVAFTLLFIILSFVKNFIPASYERLAHGIIGTIAALVTTALFLRFDGKKF
jgi:uncharacterized protein